MKKYTAWLFVLLLSCRSNEKTIKVKGSDTEVNLAVELAESFHKEHAGYVVSISGGGSGLGIASLINNTADIANSSRSMNAKERALFVKEHADVDSFIFAQDAIGFVVADDMPLDSVSMTVLAKLLSGAYDNWSSLTDKDLPINIYGRQSNSGTHDYVRKVLAIEFSPYAKEMNGNAQILEGIRKDHSGIGYVGAGYLINGGDDGLKVLKVYEEGSGKKAASALDAAVIQEGEYLFQRPLFQYYRRADWDKVKPIIDYEKTPQGKKIIADAGYYPVK